MQNLEEVGVRLTRLWLVLVKVVAMCGEHTFEVARD